MAVSAGEIERLGREVRQAKEAKRSAGRGQDTSAYASASKALSDAESAFNKTYPAYASEMAAKDQRPKTQGELTN